MPGFYLAFLESKMMTAPIPTPQYISLANITGTLVNLLGEKIEFVADSPLPLPPDAINTTLANELIAVGETNVLMDLSPYYITRPALITTTGGDWTTLSYETYTLLYYWFVSSASLELIGNFIARNTDEENRTLSYFQRFYTSEYNKYFNRIVDLLPNGSYKYQLYDLQASNTGINRIPRRYAIAGQFGTPNYTDSQTINPARNFDLFWAQQGFFGNNL
jgi:hypothetical protein